jgi:hypothetical protein
MTLARTKSGFFDDGSLRAKARTAVKTRGNALHPIR